MSALLQAENLRAGYGPIEVLKGISFTVNAGEIVTIIGANGAGKTTTLLTLSGCNRVRAGQVRFEGRPIHGLPPDALVRLGLCHCPEGRKIFSRLTVRENLQMGAFVRRDRAGIRRDMEQAYHLFPILSQRQAQAAGTLSGGEQQMLAVARALMARPRLLLLDEPSLGLAPLLVRRIFEVVRQLNKEGMTILLVEQNARLALQLADRGYVLETGAITLGGAAGDLLQDRRVQSAYLGE
jgi:branched-chain amino acid transport system ATP-binding protein